MWQLAQVAPHPLLLDDYLRRNWVFVEDPIEAEFIQSPALQIRQANERGYFVGDCDDAATLAAAVLLSDVLCSGFSLMATRQPHESEFSHVFLRCYNPDCDIDPTAPAGRVAPDLAGAEAMEVRVL